MEEEKLPIIRKLSTLSLFTSLSHFEEILILSKNSYFPQIFFTGNKNFKMQNREFLDFLRFFSLSRRELSSFRYFLRDSEEAKKEERHHESLFLPE